MSIPRPPVFVQSELSDSGEYFKGNIMYEQRKWEEAIEHYHLAFTIFSTENDLHPTTSSTELRLACVAMEEKKLDNCMYDCESN